MTLTATQPHPIYLAGKWVESPDPLEVANPADPATPAGATYNATEAQYEEAVQAAVRAFEEMRVLPAYERGRALREISNGIRARREELARGGRATFPRTTISSFDGSRSILERSRSRFDRSRIAMFMQQQNSQSAQRCI